MLDEDVIDTSFKIPKVPALTPRFTSSHLIIHTRAKPSDADSGMCFTPFSVCSTFAHLHMHAALVVSTPPVIWKVSGSVFENSIPHLALYLY